jgi:hypothetical protein
MIKALISTALLLVSAVPLPAHNDVLTRAHKTTHQIELVTVGEDVSCSATAIGPHALLTASHCELPTDEMEIDGEDAKILALSRDKFDHTIYLTDVSFKDYATFSKDPLEVGDNVFIIGNPGELTDIYRQGYLAGVRHSNPFMLALGVEEPDVFLFDLNGWEGDSGSGIFNEKGELVGVVSVMAIQHLGSEDSKKSSVFMKFMGSWGLKFTEKQIEDAKSF